MSFYNNDEDLERAVHAIKQELRARRSAPRADR
jgi:hypothetical protein